MYDPSDDSNSDTTTLSNSDIIMEDYYIFIYGVDAWNQIATAAGLPTVSDDNSSFWSKTGLYYNGGMYPNNNSVRDRLSYSSIISVSFIYPTASGSVGISKLACFGWADSSATTVYATDYSTSGTKKCTAFKQAYDLLENAGLINGEPISMTYNTYHYEYEYQGIGQSDYSGLYGGGYYIKNPDMCATCGNVDTTNSIVVDKYGAGSGYMDSNGNTGNVSANSASPPSSIQDSLKAAYMIMSGNQMASGSN